MNIKKVKRKVKHVVIVKHDIFESVFDFNYYQDKEKEKCKKLGINYDPFEQFGSNERWNDFYKNQVNGDIECM